LIDKDSIFSLRIYGLSWFRQCLWDCWSQLIFRTDITISTTRWRVLSRQPSAKPQESRHQPMVGKGKSRSDSLLPIIYILATWWTAGSFCPTSLSCSVFYNRWG